MEDAISIEWRSIVIFGGVLYFGSIYYRCLFVWGVIRFSVVGVVIFHVKVCNVVIHGEADRALGVNGFVVPIQINAGVKVSLPFLSEVIVFGESFFEVYRMLFANVLNSKDVNEQETHYWEPSVLP